MATPNKKAARTNTSAANEKHSRLPSNLPSPASLAKPFNGNLQPRSEGEMDRDEAERETISFSLPEALHYLDAANKAAYDLTEHLDRLIPGIRSAHWWPRDLLPHRSSVCTFAEQAVRNLHLALYHLSSWVVAEANSRQNNGRGNA